MEKNDHKFLVKTAIFTAWYTLVQSVAFDRMSSVCVRLSVTLVDCDNIRWNSSKTISRLLSLGFSLSADPTSGVYSKGNTRKFGPKVTHPCWFERRRHSIAIVEECLQIAQWSQWRAYRKPPSLFWKVPSLTLYDLPFPQMGVFHMPPRYANGHISAMGDPIRFMFGSRVGFSGSAYRMALFPVTSNPGWRLAAILDNFEWPYLRNGSFDPLI